MYTLKDSASTCMFSWHPWRSIVLVVTSSSSREAAYNLVGSEADVRREVCYENRSEICCNNGIVISHGNVQAVGLEAMQALKTNSAR